MTRDEVRERVVAIVRQVLGNELDDWADDDFLIANIGCDAADCEAIAMAVEDWLGMHSPRWFWIDPDEATLGDLVDAVLENMEP